MTSTPCSVNGCDEPAKTRGYCSAHYARVWRDGDPGPADLKRKRQEGPCSAEGCDAPAKTRGLCGKHYQRDRKHGSIETRPRSRAGLTHCTYEGCDRKHHAHGLCVFHSKRKERGLSLDAPSMKTPRDGTCEGPECDDPILAKRLCAGHYAQHAAGLELTPKRTFAPKGGPCSVKVCDRSAEVEGMCTTHRRRFLRGQTGWDDVIPEKAPDGTGYIDPKGYRIITVDGKQWREHRYNAEQVLGRSLRPNEDVHHVDTNRTNNQTDGPFELDERGRLRSGNLEVWSHTHPRGGEVGPRLEWFAAELEAYADVLPESLIEQLAGIVERHRS